jgi:hypothetical protein
LEIRPYNSGRVRIWVWTPSDHHDGSDPTAEAAGETIEQAARSVLGRLDGHPVCTWCDAVRDEEDTMRWERPAPNAWVCPPCQYPVASDDERAST